MLDKFIHPYADVETLDIGEKTKIWRWSHVCSGAKIGKECIIGQGCYIGPNVKIGDRVHIQNGCFIPELVSIGDDVFIGPNTVFTNDKYPPQLKTNWKSTIVMDWVSIGANCTILPGIILYPFCMIGAGSVVTKSVQSNILVIGNPAHECGYNQRI